MSMNKRMSFRFLFRFISVLFLATCLVLMIAPAAQSKSYTVTTAVDTDCSGPDNQCDLPSALAEANGNTEADTLNLVAGTYTAAAGTLFSYNWNSAETYGLTIAGDVSGPTILDGGGTVQVLYLESPGSVTISDLTIQNGNSALENGGGLMVSCNGIATITSVIIQSNTGQLDGGGAYVSAALGGTIRNSEFVNNLSDKQGGGVRVNVVNGDLILHNNLFDSNQANYHGGAAYVNLTMGTVTVTGNDFITNDVLTAGYHGGGLWLGITQGDGNVSWNIFDTNRAAADVLSGAGYGGGLYLQPASGTMGSILLEGNILVGNVTGGGGRGGGVYVSSGYGSLSDFTAMNNVFLENLTSDDGSAMYYETYEHTLNFINNTATLNTGSTAVYIRLSDSMARANIYNNILWGNTGADLGVFDGSLYKEAGVYLYNNDMVNYGVEPAIGTTNKTGGGNILDDPLLVDAANGGIHLGSGSPAIDKGLNSAPGLTTGSVDFEGEDRIQGASVDIGADEAGGGSLPSIPNIVVSDSDDLPDDHSMGFVKTYYSDGTSSGYDDEFAEVLSTGSAPLLIGTIDSIQPPFGIHLDYCSHQSLEINESCSFVVRFDPTNQSVGSYSGTVTIPSNDSDSPMVAINLSGTVYTNRTPPPDNNESGCSCSLTEPAGFGGATSLVLLGFFALGLLAWRRSKT